MSRLARPLVLSGILVLLLTGATGSVVGGVGPNDAARATVGEVVTRAALAFRSDGGSGFEARLPGYGVSVSAGGATVAGVGGSQPLRLRLDGARPDAVAAGRVPLPGRINLFLGDDPSQWRTDVATYGQAAFTGVWEGIDVVWYGKGPHLEQDFVVAPGADPDRIAISFPDGRDLSVTEGGDLVVQLPTGRARLGAPTVYQSVGDQRRQVSGSYVIREGGQVGFRVGPHDRARPLVIDPVLLDSTFLGGGGNDAAYGVAVDGDGSIYVSGSTESPDFPVTAPVQAALVQGNGPRSDAFMAKINPDGSGFAYSTFLGGRARDVAYGVALGSDGSAYVSGSTESTDFPLARPIQNVYGGGGTDAFVSKLSPQGVVLQYSTYLGGAGADGARGVAVDLAGNAYVTGTTTSNNFPVAGVALQATPNKPDDTAGFATKVNPAGDAWVYSTYLGGSGDDHGTAIAVSATGDAFVVGDTRSPDFPVVRGFQPRPGAPPVPTTATADAFVVRLPAAGAPAVYATYLGGFEADMATGVDVDATGAAYVTGSTGSSNFPLAKAVQINKRGEYDAFVSKVNPAGTGLVYSTFLGGSDSDGGAAITVADDGAASVTGTVASGDFPTVKPFQAAKGGGFIDGFVASYTPTGSAVTQASYLGGRDDDQGTAITSKGVSTLYVAGYTSSPDFPVASSLRPARAGAGDALVATVGEPPVGAATGTPGAPARERRLRIFGAVTAVLFLGAVLQTLWLRRRPAPDEPTPVPAGTPVGAAAGAGDDQWYKQPPPRFSDLPPLRPRAVPSPAPTSGRSKSAPPDSAVDGDVAVPDLLPSDQEEEWTRGPAPADATSWTTEDTRGQEAAGAAAAAPQVDVQAPDLWGPTDAEEAVAVDPGSPEPRPVAGATLPRSVDMQAPDLWDAVESPGDDLADDPMWAELMAAEGPSAPPVAPAGPVQAPPGKGDKAKSKPTEPEPTEPEPTEPEPTEPEPAMPEPAMPEPAMPEPVQAQHATAEPGTATPEPAEVPSAPPSKKRRRKGATPAEPVPAATGAASADGDWMAELWLERPEDRPAPAADKTRSDVDDAAVPAQATRSDAGAEVGRPPAPTAPEAPGKPRGRRARRRAAAGDRDSGRRPAAPVTAVPDIGLDTAEVLATPPPLLAPPEATPAASTPPPLTPGTPSVTGEPAGMAPEVASPPLAQSPERAPEQPAPKQPAAKQPAAKQTAAMARPPKPPARPAAAKAAAEPPAAAATPAKPPAAGAPKPAATEPAAARPPVSKPPAARAGASKRPAARPSLPPPTQPVAPVAAPAAVRVVPPAGDPFAPGPMRATTTPTEAPEGPPPESPRRTARRTDTAPDWRRSGAEARPPLAPLPPATPAPDLERLAAEAGLADADLPAPLDLERDVVEAGLADLVGNVELADLPADALPEELSIGDLFAEDPPVPGVGDRDGSEDEPPAGDAASTEPSSEDRTPPVPPPSYPALPEAAPGRSRGLRSRRDQGDGGRE